MTHHTSHRLACAAGVLLGAAPILALSPAAAWASAPADSSAAQAKECYGAPRTTATTLVVAMSGTGRDVVVTVAFTDQGKGAAPTGSVTMSDPDGSLGTGDLDSAGRASMDVSDASPGSRLTASYTPRSGTCTSPSTAVVKVPTVPGTTTSTSLNRTPTDAATDNPGTTSSSLGGTGTSALTEVLAVVGVVLVGAGATGVAMSRRRLRTDR